MSEEYKRKPNNSLPEMLLLDGYPEVSVFLEMPWNFQKSDYVFYPGEVPLGNHRLYISGGSLIGERESQIQEDALGVFPFDVHDTRMLGIGAADGLTGLAKSARIASMACYGRELYREGKKVYDFPGIFERFKHIQEENPELLPKTAFYNAIKSFHEQIKRYKKQNNLEGETAFAGVIVYLAEDGKLSLTVGNCGNSRVWRFRGGEIERTYDHSPVDQLVREKILSDEEALTFSAKNKVTSLLGQPDKDPEIFSHTIGLQSGDIVVCSTSGAHRKFSPQKYHEVLIGAFHEEEEEASTFDITLALLEGALREGLGDRQGNASLVVMCVD